MLLMLLTAPMLIRGVDKGGSWQTPQTTAYANQAELRDLPAETPSLLPRVDEGIELLSVAQAAGHRVATAEAQTRTIRPQMIPAGIRDSPGASLTLLTTTHIEGVR